MAKPEPPKFCVCDHDFRDALDMLAFEHRICVECNREVCMGSHEAFEHAGHTMREEPDGEA